MNNKIKYCFYSLILVVSMINANTSYAQNQAESLTNTSITQNQYNQWIQSSATWMMKYVDKKQVNLSTEQKAKINKDLRNAGNTRNNRLDLSSVNGKIIAREAFNLISKNLTPAQIEQLSSLSKALNK